MKKLILSLLFVLLAAGPLFANGACVITDVTSTQIAAESNRIADSAAVIVTALCTEDSSGTFANTTIPLSGSSPTSALNAYNLTGYYLYQIGRTPGNNSASVTSCSSTCPAGNYTVTLTDQQGFALDLGLLTSNGSATASQLNYIANSTTNYPVIRSAPVIALSGVTNSGAIVRLDLIFKAF